MNSQFGRGNQMFLYESLFYFLIKGQAPRIKKEEKPWRRWKKFLPKIPLWEKTPSTFLHLLTLFTVLTGLYSIFHINPWSLGPGTHIPSYGEKALAELNKLAPSAGLPTQQQWMASMVVRSWPLSRKALLPYCLDYCQQPAPSPADMASMHVCLLSVTSSMLYWD